MRISKPGWATFEEIKLLGQYTQREVLFAKSYYDYITTQFPYYTHQYSWAKIAPQWLQCLRKVTTGKIAYPLEDVIGALEWAKGHKFYSKQFRSLARLTKVWEDGIRAIDHLMEEYEEVDKHIVRATEEVIRDTVERTLMTVDCPKNKFEHELDMLTENLVALQEWLENRCNELPLGIRNYWFQSVEYLRIAEEFVLVRFEFEDEDSFLSAIEYWQNDIEAMLDNAIKRNKLRKFSAWFVQPDKIVDWR